MIISSKIIFTNTWLFLRRLFLQTFIYLSEELFLQTHDYLSEELLSGLVYEFLHDIDPDKSILHSHYILNLYHFVNGKIVLHDRVVYELIDINSFETYELAFNNLEATCKEIMSRYS